MKEAFSHMNEIGINHSIVIYQDGITAATKNTLSHALDRKIELFHEEDLQINITKHSLQPKFIKLDNTEAENFKRDYGVKFGTLRHDKPIARFYDYNKGDVIKILRKDGSIYYRIVR
jgi:DNA-directed RNA polymerase I, II, and III subunit RPABC1